MQFEEVKQGMGDDKINSEKNSRHVKIQFRLKQDKDGYPPFATENLWAFELPDGSYELDTIPFFAREATLGDKVAVFEEQGRLWFSKLVARSSNSLLRVVLFDPGRTDELCENLLRLGCEVEHNKPCNLVAVNIPRSTSLIPIQEYLQAKSSEGWLDYEEPILRHDG